MRGSDAAALEVLNDVFRAVPYPPRGVFNSVPSGKMSSVGFTARWGTRLRPTENIRDRCQHKHQLKVEVQAQRRASSATSLLHSGHFFLSGGVCFVMRFIKVLTGNTTKK